ncbi:SNARE associated Golgi protein family [Actinidia rufa]|uniref:SNARE associated Golgi protein family n=1 Tax=Actinidia rufa TaxID=165716 RepID=A0A7J0FTY9_9ERIC|nr:SNARE associated Golgi protein family [Actinidia rufa]
MTYGGDLVNDNGAYVKLRESELEDCEADGFGGGVGVQQPPSRWCRFWWWARMAVLAIFAAVLAAVVLIWVGPFFMDEGWLEKYPKKASIIRLSGQGNWFYQCRDVTLIRISPFPYIIYNYCAVATNVKYWPYLLGSLVGMVPEIFVAIYTGILIRTLADASHSRHSLSAPQIIFNVLGFCATVATTIVVTIYAKRRLNDLHKDEQLLLQ